MGNTKKSGGKSGGGAMAGKVKGKAVGAVVDEYQIVKDEGEKFKNMVDKSVILDDDSVNDLRKSMGQTGLEAGDPNESPTKKVYANTGKSFCINKYLNTDGKDYEVDSSVTDWHKYIDESWIKNSIDKIDGGMKPLTKDVNLTRFVDGDTLGYFLGDTSIKSEHVKAITSAIKSDNTAKNKFAKTLISTDYTQKSYTSANYIKDHPSYNNKDIVLNIVARKGTKAIVTTNQKEHEIVLARGTKYHFSGVSVNEKNQLVIDMYV